MNLATAISNNAKGVFRYGTLDCFLFAANVIQDISGRDCAKAWRGQYSDVYGASRLVMQHGNSIKAFSQAFGKFRPMNCVLSGNPVLLKHKHTEADQVQAAIAVFNGTDLACLTDQGLEFLPVDSGVGCWNV